MVLLVGVVYATRFVVCMFDYIVGRSTEACRDGKVPKQCWQSTTINNTSTCEVQILNFGIQLS